MRKNSIKLQFKKNLEVSTKTLTGQVSNFELPGTPPPSLLDLKTLAFEHDNHPIDDQHYVVLSGMKKNNNNNNKKRKIGK